MDTEFRKYVLDACIEGKLKCKDAAKLLGMHPKSFSRLKRIYLQQGESALIRKKPGPKDFIPQNKTPTSIERRVVQYARDHEGLSVKVLADKLERDCGIELHATTVWRILKRCEHMPEPVAELDSQIPDLYSIDAPVADEAISTSRSLNESEQVVTYSGLPHEQTEVSDE